MSLKHLRNQLERHAPDPQRPLPYLIVSCADKDHDRTVYLIQVNGPRLTFGSVEAAHEWIEAQAPSDRPEA